MSNITYKLKRKSETNEWLVVAYVDGKRNEDMTYYTDDKQDAIDTLAAMQKPALDLETIPAPWKLAQFSEEDMRDARANAWIE
jgi:hypothetical protein